jgi:hypothetical protein
MAKKDTNMELTKAETRLLAELAWLPIPLQDADRRRPFSALQEKKLVKPSRTWVRGHVSQAWVLTAKGHKVLEQI